MQKDAGDSERLGKEISTASCRGNAAKHWPSITNYLLNRAGYGGQTEAINAAAVRIAREIAGTSALVAGSVSRTQLFEREGPSSADHVRDLLTEQIRLLADAGVDFLILETFFHLQEMLIAIECARASGLPIVARLFSKSLTIISCE